MSYQNKHLMTAGAVMVALSSFVPNPLITGEAFAQATVSTTLNISAKITNPLAITPGAALDFGTFAVRSGAGSVQVTTGGAYANTNNLVMIAAAGVQGTVQIKAPAGVTFKLSIPDFSGATPTVKLVHTTSAANTLQITKITMGGFANGTGAFATTHVFKSGAAHSVVAQFKATKAGTTTLSIGGYVVAAGTEIPGNYTGSYAFVSSF